MGVFNEKLCKLCLQLLSFLNYLGETKKGGVSSLLPRLTVKEKTLCFHLNEAYISFYKKRNYDIKQNEFWCWKRENTFIWSGKVLLLFSDLYLLAYSIYYDRKTTTITIDRESSIFCLHKTCISNESLTHIVVG